MYRAGGARRPAGLCVMSGTGGHVRLVSAAARSRPLLDPATADRCLGGGMLAGVVLGVLLAAASCAPRGPVPADGPCATGGEWATTLCR